MLAAVDWETPVSIGLAALTVLLTLRVLSYARATVGEARRARLDAAEASARELEERRLVADIELRVHRIGRAERLLQLAIAIRRVALSTKYGVDGSIDFPSLAAEFRAALAALAAIGGPLLPSCEELGAITGQLGTASGRIQSQAETAMREIESALATASELMFPEGSPRP